MRRILAPCAVLVALSATSCDVTPPRAEPQEAPKPSLDLPESDVSFQWKGTTVDQGYGGIQTAMALDLAGHPTVAYFAPAYEALPPPPDIPEIPEEGSGSDGGSRTLQPMEAGGGTLFLPGGTSWSALELPSDLPWAGDGTPIQDALEDFVPPTFYHLRYARWDGAYWTVEDVTDVSHARGLSLLHTRDGYPVIAYLDSDHEIGPEWCAGTFLRVAVRTSAGWQMTTVVPPTQVVDGLCTPGEDCPVCEVNGLDPVLAQGPSGVVGLAFRRARYTEGSLADPDTDQAFVEVQIEGGRVNPGLPQIVHRAEGAGFFSALQYATDESGWLVPHVAYLALGEFETGDAFGAWFARYDKTRDQWEKHEIEPWEDWIAGAPLQMIIDNRDIYLLMYAVRARHTSVLLDLTLLHSEDGGETWDREYIVSTGRAGGYPSLAMDPSGRLAVSFYQCGGAFEPTCDPENDGLMFALREDTGWNIDPVLHDDARLDGTFTALTFSGDTPVLAARSAMHRGPGGGQVLKVYFGSPPE